MYKWYFSLVIFLASCVSLHEYRSKQTELAELATGNKKLRRELRDLEHEKKVLIDTIQQRNARMQSVSLAMVKRLELNRIKAQLNPKMLEGLSIHSPAMTASDYEYWSKKYSLRDTHVAKNISWISEREKKIYYYLNYARLNPTGFCNRFVLPKWKRDTSNIYLITLMDYLYTMKPRNAVKPDKVQYENAKCHAVSSGSLGYVGHQRQSDKCTSSFLGECCSYGYEDALEVIMQLLVDQGVTSLGHRYICLGWYEISGIAMAAHKDYGFNVVLDFR